ncbi:Hypothetical protein D9617_29g007490 [Elsinoe fawcettii]|nr:Hypothetical protein D9617_29g007490 [Elsinoe fawcettii]
MSRSERIMPEITGYHQEEEDGELLAGTDQLNISSETHNTTIPQQSTVLIKRTGPAAGSAGDAHGRIPTASGHEWWKSPEPVLTKKKEEALGILVAKRGEDWLEDVLPLDVRPKVPSGHGVTGRKLVGTFFAKVQYEDGGLPMSNPYQYSGKFLVELARVAGMTEGEGRMVGDILREAMERRNASGGTASVEIVLNFGG